LKAVKVCRSYEYHLIQTSQY